MRSSCSSLVDGKVLLECSDKLVDGFRIMSDLVSDASLEGRARVGAYSAMLGLVKLLYRREEYLLRNLPADGSSSGIEIPQSTREAIGVHGV